MKSKLKAIMELAWGAIWERIVIQWKEPNPWRR